MFLDQRGVLTVLEHPVAHAHPQLKAIAHRFFQGKDFVLGAGDGDESKTNECEGFHSIGFRFPADTSGPCMGQQWESSSTAGGPRRVDSFHRSEDDARL